jgi:diguanylate cyclase (GGDEF)-like protein
MDRRHFAEQDLRHQSRVLQSVLNSISDAIIVCDAEGRVSIFNPAAERVFGRPAHQAMLESPHEDGGFLHLDRSGPLPYEELPLVRASWGQDCEDFVVCYRRPKDGRYFYLSVNARGFRDSDGVLSGAMAVYHDVTEELNERQALHGANLGLEERVQALKQVQVELQDASTRDPLTGLYNRRHLDRVFEEELERARREGIALGVLMLDVDHFKKFNDSFGHDAGDLVLKKVGEAVHASLRRADSLYRFGGEEFTVLLPGASLDEARQVAEKARHNVEALQLEHEGRLLGSLSISLGVAAYPETGRHAAELLRQADEALYRSKEGGRNRSSVWQAPGRDAA